MEVEERVVVGERGRERERERERERGQSLEDPKLVGSDGRKRGV
jgi:hypothetical protein